MEQKIQTPKQIKSTIQWIRTRFRKDEKEYYERAMEKYKEDSSYGLPLVNLKEQVDDYMELNETVQKLKAELRGWKNCIEFYKIDVSLGGISE